MAEWCKAPLDIRRVSSSIPRRGQPSLAIPPGVGKLVATSVAKGGVPFRLFPTEPINKGNKQTTTTITTTTLTFASLSSCATTASSSIGFTEQLLHTPPRDAQLQLVQAEALLRRPLGPDVRIRHERAVLADDHTVGGLEEMIMLDKILELSAISCFKQPFNGLTRKLWRAACVGCERTSLRDIGVKRGCSMSDETLIELLLQDLAGQ
ncbi:hypothetical protein PRIPAC_85096 [Pristionchus pacificus]|uniref:Uncharacterized protein n=1 Tax=Pristionchus pacificus TaxID=54126 RepID=A0A2A6CEY8_PRIPA|nr:hypothetical protein PRIPAC_85096 [Pristionchus pacificus]|eukprot:PDM76571.1 hypothetical protein PRIPAC_42937 [Pristionchus pacificus]